MLAETHGLQVARVGILEDLEHEIEDESQFFAAQTLPSLQNVFEADGLG